MTVRGLAPALRIDAQWIWTLGALLLAAGAGVAFALHATLALLAAAAVVGAIVLLRWPAAATPLTLGLIYSNAAIVAAQFHGVPYLVPALVPALLVLPIAYRLLIKREAVVMTSATPLLLLYLVVQIASALASGQLDETMPELTLFISQGVLLYIAIVNVLNTPALLRRAIWTVLLVGAVLAAMPIYQEMTNSYDDHLLGFAQSSDRGLRLEAIQTAAEPDARQPRAGGPIGEKNFFAQVLIVLIPLGLFRYWGERSLPLRMLALAATTVITFGVILTFSRGAALGFLVLAGALFVLRHMSLRQVLAIVLGLTVVIASFPAYVERLMTLEEIGGATAARGEADTDPVIQQRANDALAAMLAFAENPVLGVGPGRFPRVYSVYAPRVGGIAGEREYAAHSLVPGIAAATGIAGLIAFFGIFAVTMRDLARARRRLIHIRPDLSYMASGFLFALLTYLGTSVALHMSYQRYFWTLMAMAGAAAWVLLREARVLHATDDSSLRVLPPGGTRAGALPPSGDPLRSRAT